LNTPNIQTIQRRCTDKRMIKTGPISSLHTKPLVWQKNFVRPQESLWSVFHRFNFINKINTRELEHFVACSPDSLTSLNLLTQLALSGTDSDKSNHTLFDEFVITFLGIKSKQTSTLTRRSIDSVLVDASSNHLRFCPVCLKQGYHSVVFQYKDIEKCPIHNVDLESRCPECSYPIDVSLPNTSLMDGYRCIKCKSPFADKSTLLHPPKEDFENVKTFTKFLETREEIDYAINLPFMHMTANFLKEETYHNVRKQIYKYLIHGYRTCNNKLQRPLICGQAILLSSVQPKRRKDTQSLVRAMTRSWCRLVRSNQVLLAKKYKLRINTQVIDDAKMLFTRYIRDDIESYVKSNGFGYKMLVVPYGLEKKTLPHHYNQYDCRFLFNLYSQNYDDVRLCIERIEEKRILLAIALEFLVIAEFCHERKIKLSWFVDYSVGYWFVPISFYYRNKTVLMNGYKSLEQVVDSFREWLCDNVDMYASHPIERARRGKKTYSL